MGNFITQIKILGDILVIWAIKFVDKNAKKAQISGFGRYFPLSLCSKVRFWAIFGPHPWLQLYLVVVCPREQPRRREVLYLPVARVQQRDLEPAPVRVPEVPPHLEVATVHDGGGGGARGLGDAAGLLGPGSDLYINLNFTIYIGHGKDVFGRKYSSTIIKHYFYIFRKY